MVFCLKKTVVHKILSPFLVGGNDHILQWNKKGAGLFGCFFRPRTIIRPPHLISFPCITGYRRTDNGIGSFVLYVFYEAPKVETVTIYNFPLLQQGVVHLIKLVAISPDASPCP